jgi:hypothetical protein
MEVAIGPRASGKSLFLDTLRLIVDPRLVTGYSGTVRELFFDMHTSKIDK